MPRLVHRVATSESTPLGELQTVKQLQEVLEGPQAL